MKYTAVHLKVIKLHITTGNFDFGLLKSTTFFYSLETTKTSSLDWRQTRKKEYENDIYTKYIQVILKFEKNEPRNHLRFII